MAGPGRQPGGVSLRTFVQPHAERITHMTGQPFGTAYLDELTANPAVTFDSEPPTTAVLAAAELGSEKEFLDFLQLAEFRDGRNVFDRDELIRIAAAFGFDPHGFALAYDRNAGVRTQQHIQESRVLLQRVGGAGFPTYAWEAEDGWSMLNGSAFLGQPIKWAEALASLP